MNDTPINHDLAIDSLLYEAQERLHRVAYFKGRKLWAEDHKRKARSLALEIEFLIKDMDE